MAKTKEAVPAEAPPAGMIPLAVLDTVAPELYADLENQAARPVHEITCFRLWEKESGKSMDFLYAVDAREALDSGFYTDEDPNIKSAEPIPE